MTKSETQAADYRAEAMSRAGQFVPLEPPQERKCTERDSVTNRRPVEPGGGENVTFFAEDAKCSPSMCEMGETQSGLRTELVTLEVTHRFVDPIASVLLGALDQVLGGPGESVFVMDGSCEITKLTAERDAAIRELDKLRGEITSVLDRSEFASQELTRLRARVAELEAAAKLAQAANADVGSNHAPAASGAAGTELEPVAWICEWPDHAAIYGSLKLAQFYAGTRIVPQPLYRSAPNAVNRVEVDRE